MLTITQVNYIRELYFLEGKTYSEICKMTGRNFRTVKKYIEKEDFNVKTHKAKRPNRTDILRPIINEWLLEDQSRHRKQRHTAKRIYDRLVEEHSDLMSVSERTIRTLVKEERTKLNSLKNAYLKLEHPGGEAQVDFGTFKGIEDGVLKDFHKLILSFPKSNAGFTVVTRSETREALLESLVTIFSFLGYVPSAIWFDQMASAALRSRDEKGLVKVAEKVQRFATHYGFKIKFCNPDSGHEKGNVENKVGALRRNFFVPEPIITNLADFNKELLQKCVKRHEKNHYQIAKPITQLLEAEFTLMKPFNQKPFDTARYESRKVDKHGLIKFGQCNYSVSPQHVGTAVILKIMANEIEIYSKDYEKRLAIHPRLFQKGQESIHYIDFIDIIKLRPNALKYTGIYSLLPANWQRYLENIKKEEFKKAFEVLKFILLEDDLEFARKALDEAFKSESVTLTPEAVLVTYKRIKEDKQIYEGFISLPTELPYYDINTEQYDSLIRRVDL